MLTPQDIQEKEFTKAVFGGYDMNAVDEFLEEVMNDYAALYKDNAILKGKLKVLVEKVEEYRSTEDAMRMALLTAQKMGDDLLEKSKAESEQMLTDAREKSEKLTAETEERCANMIAVAEAENKAKIYELNQLALFENERLLKAEENAKQFIENSKQLAEKQIEFLNRIAELKAEPIEIPEVEKPEPAKINAEPEVDEAALREERILDTAREIDDVVANIMKDVPDPEPKAEEPALKFDDESDETKVFTGKKKKSLIDWDDDDEPTSPRPKFDFSNLKFGRNADED